MILYNNQPVEFSQFPNGEVNLKKIRISPLDIDHLVTLKYESDADLFHLLLVRAELASQDIYPRLRITYVPYSRMDRESDTYTFSLKVFADFINSMDWRRVIIYEPHSDVTPALLHRVQVVPVTASKLMMTTVALEFLDEPYQVCYPDIGAFKRYTQDFKDGNGLYGIKYRDFETGKILALEIQGEQVYDNVVIVDDLCSKGGTFVMAAERLRAKGFKKIVLVVAHCENTIFEGKVFEHIDKVITTDSILQVPSDSLLLEKQLKVIPINSFKWR